jgi:hypothetical protein
MKRGAAQHADPKRTDFFCRCMWVVTSLLTIDEYKRMEAVAASGKPVSESEVFQNKMVPGLRSCRDEENRIR